MERNSITKMDNAYIDKKISIHAPAAKVWKVLVNKEYTRQWIHEFSNGNVVTEDWELHSKIEMTDDQGRVRLEGTVTEFEPGRRLKLEFNSSGYAEELDVRPQGNLTILSSHAGPVTPNEFKEHAIVWEKGLHKIKELAEG